MLFFFCKQKTAYEMRISDWSSDVCSSDLEVAERHIDWGDARNGPYEPTLAVVDGVRGHDLRRPIEVDVADHRAAARERSVPTARVLGLPLVYQCHAGVVLDEADGGHRCPPPGADDDLRLTTIGRAHVCTPVP